MLTLSVGCSPFSACNLPVIPPKAIQVTVFDADTQTAIGCGASAVVSNGIDSGTLSSEEEPYCSDDHVLVNEWGLDGWGEDAGTYSVTVSKEGYEDYVETDIVVTSDGPCATNTVLIQAQLQAL